MDSPASISKPPDHAGDDNHRPERPLAVADDELELGLTLGAKATAGGRKGCRILTAKDFPSMPSTRPNAAAGTKRAAAFASTDGARAHQPSNSQMVVGWPPIRAFRMNSLFNYSKDNAANNSSTSTEDDEKKSTKNEVKNDDIVSEQKAGKNSSFVKVKMDGDPIGRKVDLTAHHSYHSLALALDLMFQKPTAELPPSPNVVKASKLLDGSSDFSLTYEDKDGDWMLVGDVPWRMFLGTAKRLRIMRTSDGKGPAAE